RAGRRGGAAPSLHREEREFARARAARRRIAYGLYSPLTCDHLKDWTGGRLRDSAISMLKYVALGVTTTTTPQLVPMCAPPSCTRFPFTSKNAVTKYVSSVNTNVRYAPGCEMVQGVPRTLSGSNSSPTCGSTQMRPRNGPPYVTCPRNSAAILTGSRTRFTPPTLRPPEMVTPVGRLPPWNPTGSPRSGIELLLSSRYASTKYVPFGSPATSQWPGVERVAVPAKISERPIRTTKMRNGPCPSPLPTEMLPPSVAAVALAATSASIAGTTMLDRTRRILQRSMKLIALLPNDG